MIEVWNGTEWVEGSPSHGDKYRETNNAGGTVISYWNEPEEQPKITVENIVISGADLNGSIYWVAKDSPVTITANVALPDGELMTMVEKVVDATSTVDDFRTKAVIAGGVMTMNFSFDTSGNYTFRQDRLNEGLDRIGAGFHLSFDDVEFDVYV